MPNLTTANVNLTPTGRRRRKMRRAPLAGTASGVPNTGATTNRMLDVNELGTFLRGTIEGYALANRISAIAAFNGAKKHLAW